MPGEAVWLKKFSKIDVVAFYTHGKNSRKFADGDKELRFEVVFYSKQKFAEF
jgi:hypothetical protein